MLINKKTKINTESYKLSPTDLYVCHKKRTFFFVTINYKLPEINLLTSSVHKEQDLLQLASLGDQQAFTTLYDLYKNKLFAYALRLTESEMLAEDIVQDVFLKLWNNQQSLKSIDKLDSYLFRMCKNDIINHFKRASHETLILAELFHQKPVGYNDTQETVAFKEAEKILLEVLEKLTPQQKAIYHLSREDGKTHEEIARILQIAPNTVKNHMIKAMALIRSELRKNAFSLALIAASLAFQK